MTENINLTEQDIEDLQKLSDEERNPEVTPRDIVKNRTLLEVWLVVINNIDSLRGERITPADATRVLRSWPYLKMQEVPRYQELYFDYLHELRTILEVEIDSDPEAFKAEEDAIDNRHHYLNLLLQWQLAVQAWQTEWDVTDEDSHVQVAALAEAQNFVLGEKGLVAHLDEINFNFTEAEAIELTALLDAAKEEE